MTPKVESIIVSFLFKEALADKAGKPTERRRNFHIPHIAGNTSAEKQITRKTKPVCSLTPMFPCISTDAKSKNSIDSNSEQPSTAETRTASFFP